MYAVRVIAGKLYGIISPAGLKSLSENIKFKKKYCYFGKTFKEQAREVHVRLNLGFC
jgi:hypothetical protein